jgi:hypothetical protein
LSTSVTVTNSLVAGAVDRRRVVDPRGIGEQDRFLRSRIDPVNLPLLVASGVACEHKHIGLRGPPHPIANGLGVIGDLPQWTQWRLHVEELRGVRRARRNDELALDRMPGCKRARPEFGVQRDRFRECCRDRRDAVRLEVRVRNNDIVAMHERRRADGDCQQEKANEAKQRARDHR